MEKNNKNKELVSPFAITSKVSGTAYQLLPTGNKTVQPVALLRLSVFTPVAPKERARRDFLIDASDELASLEIARQEGYTHIKIQGAKLSMSTDFKTWIGIISAFSKYGYACEKITLPFTEFARMCGLRPTDINGRARARLHNSLFNISSVTLAFRSKNHQKTMITHLVQRAFLDYDTDHVEIIGDKSLWELYRYDHKVLLGLRALSALSRKESAQSLYVYLESMPAGPLFITMRRLRERLAMESQIKDQNMTIRRALLDLKGLGYIDYHEVKKGHEIMFMIHRCSSKLRIAKEDRKKKSGHFHNCQGNRP